MPALFSHLRLVNRLKKEYYLFEKNSLNINQIGYIFEEHLMPKKNNLHHHLFDPKNVSALESKERKEQQDPEKIIKLLGLKNSDIVADLGCGTGYFSVPISNKVNKVYSIDVQQEMLDYLLQKIQSQQISNIEVLLSKDVNKIPLPKESVTVLLTVNTLHEFQDVQQMIKEIWRVLKSNGKVAIIDFKKENTSLGPPVSIRISQCHAIKLFQNMGLKNVVVHDLKSHYLLIFQK